MVGKYTICLFCQKLDEKIVTTLMYGKYGDTVSVAQTFAGLTETNLPASTNEAQSLNNMLSCLHSRYKDQVQKTTNVVPQPASWLGEVTSCCRVH